MCHSPCLARAVSALESVPCQDIPWAASPATAPLLLRDPRAAEQPVEQAGALQRSKLPARCGQGGAEGLRNGSRWEDWRFDSSET